MIKTGLALLAFLINLAGPAAVAQEAEMQLNPDWEYVADTVMGGVSTGQITRVTVDGVPATRLTGEVSLDNNGGFVQMAFDLAGRGEVFDASGYTGLEIDLIGNGEVYDLRLRTDALRRPWQSFRTELTAPKALTTLRIPFSEITPHRTDAAFDTARLRRVGIVAIGREFSADVAVTGTRFYR